MPLPHSPFVVLLLDWSNLWAIALPFFICISASTLFTVFLWRVAWKSGMPHRREPCATCIFEKGLLRLGTCRETCAVNVIPTLPLLLFMFTCSFALLFLLFPSVVLTYLFPAGLGTVWSNACIVAVAASNGGASIVLVGYFVQDKAWHREMFFRIAAAGSTAGLVLGVVFSGSHNAWLGALSTFSFEVTPFGLVAVLLTAGIEHRARWGRPVLGMRALAASTLPLFLVVLVACARILFVLSAAYPRLV